MENSEELEVMWTRTEDKAFEMALVTFPDGTPDRWKSITEKVNGKSPEEVEKHYDDLVDDVVAICAGLIPLPKYIDKPVIKAEVRMRKGRAWSEEEHRLFLQGLKEYRKGDWKSIARDYVKTKTPTQVASHAQKYFSRQNAQNKGKRKSIHDLTLDDPILVPISSSPQNFNGGSSLGCDNTANGNHNQEVLMVTNGESISPISQVSNHGGYQGHDNNNTDQTHFYNHSSMGKAGIPQHWNSPSANFVGDEGRRVNGCPSNISYQEGISEYNYCTRNTHSVSLPNSSARFVDRGGETSNGCPSNMSYQDGLSEYDNITMLRNTHSTLSPNQFSKESNGNKVNTNGHFISPQSQFSPNGGPMEYNPTNMINQSTPLQPHFYSHMDPQLHNSQRNYMSRRSLYMSNAETKVVPSDGTSNNQVKANDVSTSLPGQ